MLTESNVVVIKKITIQVKRKRLTLQIPKVKITYFTHGIVFSSDFFSNNIFFK
jgi:hypothetical protein